MARPVNDKNRELVQDKIMEASRRVFCRKGFIGVTMTDLIEAAGISRGGFYFYYKSVEEVFRATIQNRKKRQFEEIRNSIDKKPDFYDLVDSYFVKQKARLLHLDNSMLRSHYEYLFTHREESDAEFRDKQKNNILRTVNDILKYGVKMKAIPDEDIKQIAEHFMYALEGLSVMALFQGLTERTIDQQFSLLKKMLRWQTT